MIKDLLYKHIKRIILVIILIICFVFSFAQQSILNQKISFKSKNQSLYDVLKEIGSKTGYEFSYNADLIPSSKNISIDSDSVEFRKLLDVILDDTCLTYNVIDRQIVIHKKYSIGKLLSDNGDIISIDLYHITGRIIDKKTREPLPFSNISIFGKSIGTISNEEGYFSFKVPGNYIKDTLVSTYIGYKNSEIPVLELSLRNNIIYMEQESFAIEEVIIRSNNPLDLVNGALDNIKDNYYTKPYLMTSFYREFVKKNNKYTSISEAVLSVYKSPYEGLYSDQVKMIKSRKNINYSENDTVLFKLKGGLYASLYLDIIKNTSSFLLEKSFELFNYSLSDIVWFDNSTCYVVEFKPKYYIEDQSFIGKMYIDTKNLAIKSAQFSIDPEAIERLSSELVVKKSMRTIVKPISANYWVTYRQINGRYFLNLVRGELEFKVKKRRRLFSSDFKTVFEFAVNEIDTLNIERFNRKEILVTNQIFTDKNFEYDYKFWGEYNYIIPDETLQDALSRITKQMQELQNK